MTATPCGTIAVVTVLVVATDSHVLVVVGQREQEVVAATCPTIVIPVGGRITTDQTTCVELDNGDGGSFAITSTVEGRGACTISAAAVAENPVLVRATNPFVDLQHMA